MKIRNRVDCQHSEKRSKTHKRLKERFLIRRNRTKSANFKGKPLFQATYNNTTENTETNLSCVRLMLGGWREEKGMRLPRRENEKDNVGSRSQSQVKQTYTEQTEKDS